MAQRSSKLNSKQRGQSGEDLAALFLHSKGYELVVRNWRAGNALRGEVDCIAWHTYGGRRVLCFIEVKTRASNAGGAPQEAVTPSKQRQLSRLANAYVSTHNIEAPCRFDVVEVWLADDNAVPRVALHPNAFDYCGF
ncbi:MAG: putative endonuclease [Abditibacteriota bacterium]|nr:putative endonuclease [Abditibacteriota bacterium]